MVEVLYASNKNTSPDFSVYSIISLFSLDKVLAKKIEKDIDETKKAVNNYQNKLNLLLNRDKNLDE